jgi:hypothetical protein
MTRYEAGLCGWASFLADSRGWLFAFPTVFEAKDFGSLRREYAFCIYDSIQLVHFPLRRLEDLPSQIAN